MKTPYWWHKHEPIKGTWKCIVEHVKMVAENGIASNTFNEKKKEGTTGRAVFSQFGRIVPHFRIILYFLWMKPLHFFISRDLYRISTKLVHTFKIPQTMPVFFKGPPHSLQPHNDSGYQNGLFCSSAIFVDQYVSSGKGWLKWTPGDFFFFLC